MTHEEKEAIRERCEIVEFWQDARTEGTLHLCYEDACKLVKEEIPALLDVLDKAESRIEALERAIKKVPGIKCEVCKRMLSADPKLFCGHMGLPHLCEEWQFDKARFSKPEKTGGKK